MSIAVPAYPVTSYPLPDKPPRYSFVAGSWGDILCSLGNHQHLMRSLGCESGAILYYGPDAAIVDWLRIQPMVSEVADVRSPGPVSGIPTNPKKVNEWIGAFARATKFPVKSRDLYPCHVDFTLRERLPVHRPELVTAPEVAEWAADTFEYFSHLPESDSDLGRWVMFQPRSETSCLWEGHWPYWYEAARFLGREANPILCGRGEFDQTLFPDASIFNFVNCTPSMPHLFALADVCDVIVTTSNALSLYAAAKGLPTVVCCNVTHRRPEQFFTRFAHGPRSRIVEHWEGMDVFKKAWAEVVAL